MPRPDLIQVGFFKNILDDILVLGVNANNLLKTSGLNRFDLEVKENYVPATLVYDFFYEFARRESGTELLTALDRGLEVSSTGQWGELIMNAPDLLTACLVSSKFDQVQLTHEKINLSIEGARAKYACSYSDEPYPGRNELLSIILAMSLKTCRLMLGQEWTPVEIHLPEDFYIDFDTLLPEGNVVKIKFNQPELALVFPTTDLASPLTEYPKTLLMSDTFFPPPQSVGHKISVLMNSLQEGYLPIIHTVAEYFDVPTRSLQRQLQQEGTSYSEIIEQWRFGKALKLLQNPHLKIKEMSAMLKYSNTPAFEKAFRRWTNTSPNKYRDAM